MVGVSETETFASEYCLVQVVNSCTISLCDFLVHRVQPIEFELDRTERAPQPGEVIIKLTFFSGMESLIKSVNSFMNLSI